MRGRTSQAVASDTNEPRQDAKALKVSISHGRRRGEVPDPVPHPGDDATGGEGPKSRRGLGVTGTRSFFYFREIAF
jgi:hypothetical protein